MVYGTEMSMRSLLVRMRMLCLMGRSAKTVKTKLWARSSTDPSPPLADGARNNSPTNTGSEAWIASLALLQTLFCQRETDNRHGEAC